MEAPFSYLKENKNKGKERNPAPEIHRFGMTGLLEYMDCVLSELWWNNKIKRSGGLGFNNIYGIFYSSNRHFEGTCNRAGRWPGRMGRDQFARRVWQ